MNVAALEQTLRHHPDDLASWRAYGAWLIEQGDVRGALIDLEDRLAHARPADRGRIAKDIAALVREHRRSWDADLPPGVTVLTRRHGFATKVAVECSREAPQLIERSLRDRLVTALRLLPGKGPHDDDPDDDDLDYDEDDIPVPRPPIDVAALATVDLSRLVELDLSYLPIGDPGAKALANSTTTGSIRVLDLRYCYVTDEGLAALAASAHFSALRRLHPQRNRLTALGVRSLHGFPGLTELDLRYNEIGAEGADALIAAPFISSLARLSLYRVDVGDLGVERLAAAPQLQPMLRSFWRSA